MDIKNLKTQVTYRIEPKPGGGFIARATDPAVPSLEAPTREELQEKIRTEAFEKLTAEVPALKGLLEHQLKSGGLLQGKHSSAFIVRTTGNETKVVDTTPEQVNQFAKDLSGLMEKDFPELSQALAAQNDGSAKASTVEATSSDKATSQTTTPNPNLIPNTPIVPEASSRWPLVVVALAILGALLYFIFLHH